MVFSRVILKSELIDFKLEYIGGTFSMVLRL